MRTLLPLLALGLLLAPRSSSAQAALHLEGELALTSVNTVLVHGGHAYVAATGGVLILDLADPVAPAKVAEFPTPDTVVALATHGGRLLVGTREQGLLVYDLANPLAPTLLSSHGELARAGQLQVSGDLLFAVDPDADLGIYDISGNAVAWAGGLDIDDGCSGGHMLVDGTDVYLARSCEYFDYDYNYFVDELLRIDAAVPAAPVLDPGFSIPDLTLYGALRVDAGVLHLPQPNRTVRYDLGTGSYLPQWPQEGWGYFPAGGGVVVDTNNGVAFLQGTSQQGFLSLLGRGGVSTRVGDLVYRPAHRYGLQVVDISQPAAPELAGDWVAVDYGEDLARLGDVAYYSGRELYAVDIADRANMTVSWHSGGSSRHPVVDSQRGLLFHAASNWPDDHIECFDLADPRQPLFVGSAVVGSAEGMVLRNGILYVADLLAGLRLYDATDPAAGMPELALVGPDAPRGVALHGDHAYVAHDDSCHIYDIAVPSLPQRLASFGFHDILRPDDIVAAAGHLYVSGAFGGGTNIYSLADPLAPALVVDALPHDGNYAEDLELRGAQLVVSSRGGTAAGVAIYDIRDPAQPVVVATLPVLTGTASHLFGDELLTILGGLKSYRLQGATSTPLPARSRLALRSWPNPARGALSISLASPASGPVELEIFDAAGRRVRGWMRELRADFAHEFAWDGRDERGRPAARGVYFVRARQGTQEASRRVVWMR